MSATSIIDTPISFTVTYPASQLGKLTANGATIWKSVPISVFHNVYFAGSFIVRVESGEKRSTDNVVVQHCLERLSHKTNNGNLVNETIVLLEFSYSTTGLSAGAITSIETISANMFNDALSDGAIRNNLIDKIF